VLASHDYEFQPRFFGDKNPRRVVTQKAARREGTLTLPSPASNAGEGIKGTEQKIRGGTEASMLTYSRSRFRTSYGT